MVNPELGQRAARLSGWASATRWFCISYLDAKSDDSYWHHIDFTPNLFIVDMISLYIFWWQLPLNTSFKRSYSSHLKESEPFQICFEIWGFLLSHLQKGQSGPIHCYFSCMVLGNAPWTRLGAKGFNAFQCILVALNGFQWYKWNLQHALDNEEGTRMVEILGRSAWMDLGQLVGHSASS